MSSSKGVTVIGGKLKFKGSSGGSSSATKKRKTTDDVVNKSSDTNVTSKSSSSGKSDESAEPTLELHLTEAQKRHKQRRIELERKEAKKLVKSTYRDRVEQYNYKLSTMTEHNDIPRVSAAGNG
jgi:protein FAM32A